MCAVTRSLTQASAIAVEPATGADGDSLEFRSYAAAVARPLVLLGYSAQPAGSPSRQVALVRARRVDLDVIDQITDGLEAVHADDGRGRADDSSQGSRDLGLDVGVDVPPPVIEPGAVEQVGEDAVDHVARVGRAERDGGLDPLAFVRR